MHGTSQINYGVSENLLNSVDYMHSCTRQFGVITVLDEFGLSVFVEGFETLPSDWCVRKYWLVGKVFATYDSIGSEGVVVIPKIF